MILKLNVLQSLQCFVSLIDLYNYSIFYGNFSAGNVTKI